MKIEIIYSNNPEEVYTINTESKENVYEIATKEGGRISDIPTHLQYITYTMGQIENPITDSIESMKISELPFLTYVSKGNTLHSTESKDFDQINTVIYDMAYENIVESKYVYKSLEDKELNANLLSAKHRREAISFNYLNGIVTKYLPKFKLQINKQTNQIEVKYATAGRKVQIDHLRGEDWVFFTLMQMLLSRGEHNGIFYINCTKITNQTLTGLIMLIKLFLKENKLIFIYNTEKTYVTSEKIEVLSLN